MKNPKPENRGGKRWTPGRTPCKVHGTWSLYQAVNEEGWYCAGEGPHQVTASRKYTAAMQNDMRKLGIEYENQEEGNGEIR